MISARSKGGTHTHRNTQQANEHLNARNYHECLIYTKLEDPVVCAEGKAEGEEVLEDDEAGEDLDRDIA